VKGPCIQKKKKKQRETTSTGRSPKARATRGSKPFEKQTGKYRRPEGGGLKWRTIYPSRGFSHEKKIVSSRGVLDLKKNVGNKEDVLAVSNSVGIFEGKLPPILPIPKRTRGGRRSRGLRKLRSDASGGGHSKGDFGMQAIEGEKMRRIFRAIKLTNSERRGVTIRCSGLNTR